ncbi:heterokaryon incompatibility protein-domain-containing protein [Annulohypoxylon moriforme]|nr:heterokaryon incompatibility protein-domain-containing protein [Annulohypoxylon moriforme]
MAAASDQDNAFQKALIYTPLDPNRRQIRLIEILPCNTEEDEVSCVLKIVELKSNPRYAALSYVWGDANVTKGVKINGNKLDVTTNLESALRRFRKTGFPQNTETGEIALVWADAICINQNDTVEKGHQVTLMASIYREATSVLSWLGLPDENNVDRVFQDIHDLMAIVFTAVKNPNDNQEVADTMKSLGVKWLFENFGPVIMDGESPNSPRWKDLFELRNHIYWSRMWIIQEMALARSPLTHWFICGDVSLYSMEFEFLRLALQTFRRPDFLNSSIRSREEATIWGFLNVDILPANNTIRYFQEVTLRNPSEGCLVDCIVKSAVNASATCAEDCVYAMMSLTPNNVVPKYGKPIREIYLDAVLSDGIARCVETCLGCSGKGLDYGSNHGLPSWLPDFSKIRSKHVPMTTNARPFLNTVELKPVEIIQQNTLCIQGVSYGRVDLVQSIPIPGGAARAFASLQKFCVDCLLGFGRFNDKPLQTLMNVLTCGIDLDESRWDKTTGRPYMTFSRVQKRSIWEVLQEDVLTEAEERNFHTKLGLPPGITVGSYLAANFIGGLDELETVQKDAEEEWKYGTGIVSKQMGSILRYTGGKILFRTDKGHFGIGPPSLQSGDLISALDNCRFSSLLRKHESQWKNVGACYIPELYHVGIAEMVKNRDVQIETFEIR